MAGEPVEEVEPGGQGGRVDPVASVVAGQHRVVGRIAEDQVASARFGRKAIVYVVCLDIGTHGMEVIREAAASHGRADVERRPAAGHRVDDQGAGAV